MSDTITVTFDVELSVNEMDAALSKAKTVRSTIPTELDTEITAITRNK